MFSQASFFAEALGEKIGVKIRFILNSLRLRGLYSNIFLLFSSGFSVFGGDTSGCFGLLWLVKRDNELVALLFNLNVFTWGKAQCC